MDSSKSEELMNPSNTFQEEATEITKPACVAEDMLEKASQKELKRYSKEVAQKELERDIKLQLPSLVWGYRRAMTTNQEYGLWASDPYLKDKDWYKVRRYPIRSSYPTRYRDALITGVDH